MNDVFKTDCAADERDRPLQFQLEACSSKIDPDQAQNSRKAVAEQSQNSRKTVKLSRKAI